MGKGVICLLLSMGISAMLALGGHADTLQSWFDAHGYNINVATDELGIERLAGLVYGDGVKRRPRLPQSHWMVSGTI